MTYAVITSTDPSYLYTARALCRGLTMYGNDCDIHLLHTEDMPSGWTVGLPARVHTHLIADLPEMAQVATDPIRGRPWQVRFARYVLAAQLCDVYDVVAIWDSDSFVVGNLMDLFTWVANTQEMAMPQNIHGVRSLHGVSAENITRATQPTYHCHGAFFPKKYKHLLEQVFFQGLEEAYGDMVSLHRILQYYIPKDTVSPNDNFIRPLSNNSLVCSAFWSLPVRVVWTPEPTVSFGGIPVLCVHGKWHLAEVRNKAIMTQVFKPEARIQAEQNLLLFNELYHWFNHNKGDV